jgi:hypothetical protein
MHRHFQQTRILVNQKGCSEQNKAGEVGGNANQYAPNLVVKTPFTLGGQGILAPGISLLAHEIVFIEQ